MPIKQLLRTGLGAAVAASLVAPLERSPLPSLFPSDALTVPDSGQLTASA